jgi:hypothetical protein
VSHVVLMVLWSFAIPFAPKKQTIRQTFSTSGIATVVVRAHKIKEAKVKAGRPSTPLVISGTPAGDASGYHPPDPKWKETPAHKQGIKFLAKRYGSVLVISTEKEVWYIHHYYYIKDITITLPPNVKLVRQERVLDGDDGDPKADLSRP